MYQWQKGEYLGEYSIAVDTIQEDDMNFIVFKDGRRINTDLVNEFLIPVNSEEEGFIFSEEIINDIVTQVGKDGVKYDIPGPDHGKKLIKKVAKKVAKTPVVAQESKATNIKKSNPIPSSDPMIALLDRAKKKMVTFDIKLSLSTINQETFHILSENFDNSEDMILEYLYENIDKDVLKTKIKEYLRQNLAKSSPIMEYER